MLGGQVNVQTTVEQLCSKDLQGIVVVGGMGSPDHLWNNEALLKLLAETAKQGKVVAGICLSGAVLANAGVLQGKQATVWACPESLQALEQGKAQYCEGQHVVIDDNTITADGPEAATEFGTAVSAALQRIATRV
jgi:protease I